MDLLLASHRGWERAEGLTRLPKAALPPGALILVFSPLLHPRLVEALRDLRERGFSVLVVDVLTAEPSLSRNRTDELTRRIWRLEQQAIRFSLTELGIPVVHWDGRQSLDEPLAPYTRRVMLAGPAMTDGAADRAGARPGGRRGAPGAAGQLAPGPAGGYRGGGSPRRRCWPRR